MFHVDLTLGSGRYRCSLREGERVALIGPSGAGKSTFLRAVAGLEPATGSVRIRERDWHRRPVHERPIGFLSQHAPLFRRRSVAQNIAFGLPGGQLSPEAMAWIRALGLESWLERPSHHLSGGERRRVALVRMLVRQPEVLLLDEPFTGLDPLTSGTVQEVLWRVQKDRQVPLIWVTHDLLEAQRHADRILVLIDGRIQDDNRPEALLHQPKTPAVASFLGYESFAPDPDRSGFLALHPKRAVVGAFPDRGWVVQGTVASAQGHGTDHRVEIAGEFGHLAVILPYGQPLPDPGSRITVTFLEPPRYGAEEMPAAWGADRQTVGQWGSGMGSWEEARG